MRELYQNREELWLCKITRAAAAVVLVSGVGVALIETFSRLPFLQHNTTPGAALVAGLGVFLALIRPGLYAQKETPNRVLRFHCNPHFWALVLLGAAAVFYVFARTPDQRARVLVVHARPLAAAQQTPVEFPSLRVSAVAVCGRRSSALINGQTVFLGESMMSGVKLVRVSSGGIAVELKGARKEIKLGAK